MKIPKEELEKRAEAIFNHFLKNHGEDAYLEWSEDKEFYSHCFHVSDDVECDSPEETELLKYVISYIENNQEEWMIEWREEEREFRAEGSGDPYIMYGLSRKDF